MLVQAALVWAFVCLASPGYTVCQFARMCTLLNSTGITDRKCRNAQTLHTRTVHVYAVK